MFRQNRYAAEQGQRLGFATRPWEAAWKYTAYRSVQIFDIFKQVNKIHLNNILLLH